MPRHFAAVDRLAALGFTREHSVADSMAAVVAYYRDEVGGRRESEGEGDPRDDHDHDDDHETMTVTATATHSYAVEVAPGILDAVPSRLATLFPGAHLVMLTDCRVHELYGARLLAGLRHVDPPCDRALPRRRRDRQVAGQPSSAD